MTTYGPVGRVVATLIVGFPMWLMWKLRGPYHCTILGLVSYPYLVRLALKDIWRPVRRDTAADATADAATIEFPSEPLTDPERAIATRATPARW